MSRQISYLEPLLAKIFKIPSRKIKLTDAEITEEEIIEFFVDATEQPVNRLKRDKKATIPVKRKNIRLKLFDEKQLLFQKKQN